MPQLELISVRKQFQGVTALDGVSLNIKSGELLCLLGPSGCGKTTTLRIIAGFETPDGGEVQLDGQDITRVPPEKRDIGIVFQSYALFPHLTVKQNVAFGLKMRRRPEEEIERAVSEALKLVQLESLGNRFPRQLSGGQQQRVALARAVAIRPRLLLLDEPLSNLDAKLRDEMREEIRRIQRTTGLTTLLVTHDQSEALALADRMAIMHKARILQIDTPRNIYESPLHPFVASFMGQTNLIRGTVISVQDGRIGITSQSGFPVFGEGDTVRIGDRVIAIVKSERVYITRDRPPDAVNATPVRIEARTYLGATVQYRCSAGNGKITALQLNEPGAAEYEVETAGFASWRESDCLILHEGADL
jgi:putative spermidine/putrescine transport system ATP-binding protein